MLIVLTHKANNCSVDFMNMYEATNLLLTCMNMHEYYNGFRGCRCPLICMASVVQETGDDGGL